MASKSVRRQVSLPRTNYDRKVQWSTSVGVAVAVMLCYGRRLNNLIHNIITKQEYKISEK